MYDYLYDALNILVAGYLGYRMQVGSALRCIERYKIPERSGLSADEIDIGGIEYVVEKYGDGKLLEGKVLGKKGVRRTLTGERKKSIYNRSI